MPSRERRALLHLTRDLRLTDNPALDAARRAGRVVPLFVLDETLLRLPTMGANRLGFLLEALVDLRSSLRRTGSELFVRRGEVAEEVAGLASALGASEVHSTADVSFAARRRETLVSRACERGGVSLVLHPGVGVIEPTLLRPSGGGDHYRVFTPFYRAWSVSERRPPAVMPRRLPRPPAGVAAGEIPTLSRLAQGGRAADPLGRRSFPPLALGACSPRRARGGEAEARRRLATFLEEDGPALYEARHDDLALEDATSRLSAALHFGCLSPLELETRAGASGGDSLVRQLCWRDFHLAVNAAVPSLSWADYRARGAPFRREPGELAAWKEGRTGEPLVDAAMAQLHEEGFIHNRGRLVAASYLTKTLRHHWTEGAAYFLEWLTDGDVASNSGNWQWVAGTGNDTRPNRVLNPARQASRFDRDGAYRARHGTAART